MVLCESRNDSYYFLHLYNIQNRTIGILLSTGALEIIGKMFNSKNYNYYTLLFDINI